MYIISNPGKNIRFIDCAFVRVFCNYSGFTKKKKKGKRKKLQEPDHRKQHQYIKFKEIFSVFFFCPSGYLSSPVIHRFCRDRKT